MIAEDVIDEEEERIAACEDDVDPPELSDRVPLTGLSINLLGVNYGAEPEFDEEEEGNENAGSYKVGKIIGGEILSPEGANPDGQSVRGDVEEVYHPPTFMFALTNGIRLWQIFPLFKRLPSPKVLFLSRRKVGLRTLHLKFSRTGPRPVTSLSMTSIWQ